MANPTNQVGYCLLVLLCIYCKIDSNQTAARKYCGRYQCRLAKNRDKYKHASA